MLPAGSPSSRPTLEPLTGLRFLTAMAVVLFHLPSRSVAPAAIGRLIGYGFLGVSVFFVLSGFILAYQYIDPDTGALRGSARAFWQARIARIYPVYLTALLITLPIFVIFRVLIIPAEARPAALLSGLLTPFMLQAWSPRAATQWNTPGWSLSVELFFYALFPLAAVWLARRGRHAALVAGLVWAACLAAPLAYLAVRADAAARSIPFDWYFWLQAVKFNPLGHLGEFAIGVVAGLTFLRRGASSFVASRAFASLALVGLVALAVVAAQTTWLPYLLVHNGLLAPLWAAVILSLAARRGRVARLLGSRPLVRLGEASYALYLLHVPLLGYKELAAGFLRIRAPELTAPGWVHQVGLVVVAIALSVYVFRRVEEPGRRKIRSWGPESVLPAQIRHIARRWRTLLAWRAVEP